MVLADHFDDVTENGMFHRIDMHAIEAAVKQMLAPEQEAVLSSAHHYLHTHKQLASAVRKAIHHQSQVRTDDLVAAWYVHVCMPARSGD